MMVTAGEEMSPNADDDIVIFAKLSEFIKVKVEPVGKWFEKLIQDSKPKVDSEDPLKDEDNVESSDSEEEYEDNSDYVRKLDPKEWKNQDHYAVLGLKNKRYLAKDEQIKKAYRKIVLLHHPDKRRSAGENIKDLDHDYYSCITKAYEMLGNPVKRRSYDSIDPEFDDDIPLLNSYSKENFFELFWPVFSENSRWSVNKPVPDLGTDDSTVEDVDEFYSFWYDFESWREFSYLDEEEKEKGENREERKWIEKQNKIARQKRKKDEMARLRQLVDAAYACDPRILRFKEQKRQQKEAQKKAKQDAARLKAEEEERKRQEILDAEKKIKEKEEAEEKMKRNKEKKEKDVMKKLLKKERKLLQQICEKHNYFSNDETDKVSNLRDVDKLSKLLPLEKLQSLNSALETEDNSCNKKEIFIEYIDDLNKQLELEKEKLLALSHKSSTDKKSKNQKPWSHEDLQLLVKAVNLFPAGTNNRWETIATFMGQHSTTRIVRTAKDVLDKAKDLQKQSGDLKEQVNKNAYENLEKSQKTVAVPVKDQSAPTERFEGDSVTASQNPWTAEEQQLLEQALKTFPASTQERWEKISNCVPGRSKKECMRRYKDLVEMVKAKKAAQAVVSQKMKKG